MGTGSFVATQASTRVSAITVNFRLVDVNVRPSTSERHGNDVDKGGTICPACTAGSHPPAHPPSRFPPFVTLLSVPDFPRLPLTRDKASVPTSVGFSTERAVHTLPSFVF